jgi:hypothetical protein
VIDAAGVGAALWLSYLFVLFYLAIAVGGVTHRDLLLENPVKLPFLNVDLPLKSFFVLGPLLFLVVHAYVLLHLVLLAGKVGAFHTELHTQIAGDDAQARLRRQLPSNIFVQFLAGPREVRTGIVGFILRLIAWISLVLAPLALLTFFQLQSLPYHSPVITWWQRLAIVIDLVLLWRLWPSITRGETIWLTRNALYSGRVTGAAVASLLHFLFVFFVATFPGEWLYSSPPIRFIPKKWLEWTGMIEQSGSAALKSMRWVSPYDVLFAGEVDLNTRRIRSIVSNRLVVPHLDVIDHTKFDSEVKVMALPESIFLAGRHLENAVLANADLRKANFTDAHLQGAHLDGAQLQGALLDGAELQGVSLDGAQLQGASLNGAQLQGASLDNARLQGVSLIQAQLQGASLALTQLQGANLLSAKLDGAYLDHAQFQGAYLVEAQLWGAVLNGAEGEGAILDRAQLQGALLDGAQLQSASLRNVFVWRADPRSAATQNALVITPERGPKYSADECPPLPCNWPPKGYMVRGGSRLDPVQELKDDEQISEEWTRLEKASPFVDDYEKNLVNELIGIGCESNEAPYVIRKLAFLMRSIFDPWRLPLLSPHPAQLAAALLDEDHCFGARGLSEKDKTTLREIKNRVVHAAPTSENRQPVQ